MRNYVGEQAEPLIKEAEEAQAEEDFLKGIRFDHQELDDIMNRLLK